MWLKVLLLIFLFCRFLSSRLHGSAKLCITLQTRRTWHSGFVLHFIFITLLLLLVDQIFKIKLEIPVIGLKMLILQYTSILLILGKYWFLKFYSFFFFCSKFWSTYSLNYSFRYLITYSSIFFLLFTVSTTCYFTIKQNCIISRLGITLS